MDTHLVINDGLVFIGLTNPKSPTNVGSVMRAAGCFGVDAVYYTGKRYAQAARFHTDTNRVTDRIALSSVKNFSDDLPANTRIVCVDLVEGATPLPDYEHYENAIYIFGPEDGTLTQEQVDEADDVVYIPTTGCLNLAATVNVLLYDRLMKSGYPHASDQLIRESRDRNNSVKINNT